MARDRRLRLTDRIFIRALQSLRLEGLKTGRFEPLSDRETFYLRLCQAGRRPDPEDFILSPALFHLERMQIMASEEEEEEEPAASDQAFTPAAEPAISPE